MVVDLMGFTIGPCVNAPSLCPVNFIQPGILGSAANDVTIRNGVVQNFRGNGVQLGQRALVEGLVVRGNARNGISVEAHSIVRNNRIALNDLTGLLLGFGSAWSGNVLTQNGTDFSGAATATGDNLCSGRRCGRVLARRFYRTSGSFSCSAAPTQCDAGFRQAYSWELSTSLQYDETRGPRFSFADPPGTEVSGEGWIADSGGRFLATWVTNANANGDQSEFRVTAAGLCAGPARAVWCIEE